MTCVEARGLRKVFKTTPALDGIDLRIDDEFHVERRARAAGRGRAKAAPEMLAFAEGTGSVRGDRLAEKRRGDGRGRYGSGNRAGRCERKREGAIIRDRRAAECRLMAGDIEDVGRERMVALDEENDAAAAGQISLVKPALAFLREARDRQSDQERADLN